MQTLWGVWRFLKPLKTEVPYDPAVLLSGNFPKEMKQKIKYLKYRVISPMYGIKKTIKTHRYNRCRGQAGFARGGWEVGEMHKGSQTVQSSHRNEPWGCDVEQGDYS